MSKPELTGAKSLEEILASIRKSLADDDAPGAPTASPRRAKLQLEPLHARHRRPGPACKRAGQGRGHAERQARQWRGGAALRSTRI